MEQPLLIERRGGVAVLTLNNPDRLNALSLPLRQALATEVPALIADPTVRAIMITGAGRGFCAGGDFGAPRAPAKPVQVHDGLAAAQSWMRLLVAGRKPVVTAVNGPAAGAGFGLAMLGDVVLASDTAFFKAGFPRIGVSADYLLSWTLPRAIGYQRAFDVLTGDRRVTAEQGLGFGFVTEVHPAADLVDAATKHAARLADSPFSVGLIKRLLRRASDRPLDEHIDAEALSYALAAASDDYAEGTAAFRDKRQPRFVGQ